MSLTLRCVCDMLASSSTQNDKSVHNTTLFDVNGNSFVQQPSIRRAYSYSEAIIVSELFPYLQFNTVTATTVSLLRDLVIYARTSKIWPQLLCFIECVTFNLVSNSKGKRLNTTSTKSNISIWRLHATVPADWHFGRGRETMCVCPINVIYYVIYELLVDHTITSYTIKHGTRIARQCWILYRMQNEYDYFYGGCWRDAMPTQ